MIWGAATIESPGTVRVAPSTQSIEGPPVPGPRARSGRAPIAPVTSSSRPELAQVRPLDKGKIPGCTSCNPQVASVGITESKASALGFDIRVGRFPFIGNGKAIALGESDGLVKTVFDKRSGQLLGAHMVGAELTELIHSFVVAMNLETTEAELMQTVFAHPALSEVVHEGVLAYGRAIHY